MPSIHVVCPNCGAPGKAPANLAGKKARCKKCETAFRISGPVQSDSAGDSQRLSVAGPPPAAAAAVEEDVPSAMPVEDDEPAAASVADDEPFTATVAEEEPAPAATADPFAFSSSPPPPPPPAKKSRKPREEEPPPAPAEPAAADPFAFAAEPAAPPARKPRKPRDEEKPAPPAPAAAAATGDPFAFSGEATPPAAKKSSKPRNDDTPPPAPGPAADGDPFGFAAAAAAPPAKKTRQPDDDRDEPDDDTPRPAGRKAKPAGGGGGLVKVAVAAAVFALVCGGVVAGVLVYVNTRPAGGEQARAENKDQKKADPAPADPPPPTPPTNKADAVPAGKDRDAKAPRPGAATPAKATRGKSGMLALAPGKALAFPPRPPEPKMVTEPASSPLPLAVAFPEVRRFFPPLKADADVGVAWRSAAGFQGVGEKVTLTLFSPNSGNEVAKVETDGDGSAEPAYDLSADAGTFAAGDRVTGKVTVWDVRKKQKKLDAFDPYKELPDHKAAKLAAVYLTEPPDRVVTVTTAGAVHVWDVKSKSKAGEFVPPKGAAGRVGPGRGVAPAPGRQGVVVAVAGTVYKVDAVGDVTGAPVAELGGDVGRSLAVALSPGGKVVYAFETDADGPKEKAVALLADGKLGPVLRWPADAGEPLSAGWAGDGVASLATSQGAAVWFDAEAGFNLLGIARTPGDKAAHAVADTHWSLIPAAGNAKGCVAVELALPPQGVGDPLTPAARRPPASLVLDAKGLSQ